MERDASISHGTSAYLRERLMFVSDAYQTVFCKTCGTFAINDATIKMYKPCRLCGTDNSFGRCTIPYAYKLLIHLLAAMGINLRPEFMTSDEYIERILRRHNEITVDDTMNIKQLLGEADEALDDEMQEFDDIDNEDVDYGEVYD